MDFLQYFIPFVEIAIIAVILNYLLSFFWNTRAMDLVIGFAAFLLLFAAASWLQLPVLRKLMLSIVNVVVLAAFIIFQPELRMAFSRLMSVKGKRYQAIADFDAFLDSLVTSTYRFANKKIGAIVLLESQDLLDEYTNKAVVLNAKFSSELLETVFMTKAPLHDGALVIRGRSIVAAGVILPLADDSSQIDRSMGTRHRAALGISQITDALSIVVSEETGRVSIARDGIITQGVKPDRFRGIIRSIYHPPKLKAGFSIRSWFQR